MVKDDCLSIGKPCKAIHCRTRYLGENSPHSGVSTTDIHVMSSSGNCKGATLRLSDWIPTVKMTMKSVAVAAAVVGFAALGTGTAAAQPAGQWSEDGLTYCDPYCSNFDKTAPRFSAEPSAYVCTSGPNPASAACQFGMILVRALPPLPFGEFAQSTGSFGN